MINNVRYCVSLVLEMSLIRKRSCKFIILLFNCVSYIYISKLNTRTNWLKKNPTTEAEESSSKDHTPPPPPSHPPKKEKESNKEKKENEQEIHSKNMY